MMNRREVIATVAVGSAVLLADRSLAAAPPAAAPSTSAPSTSPLEAKPLPFDPAKLKGISEKLIVSHHDNNYAGAVKNLVKVREQLAATNKDTPGFLVGGLREKELTYFGSMVLHELYFGNLGGDGKPSGNVVKAAPPDWEERMRATAMSLGGGSGWASLDYAMHTGEVVVSWSGNHTQNLAASLPLLVLDMYEHAYQMDYGAAHAKYIDAFFQNVKWDEVEKRFERAKKARAAWVTT
jgi:superoxide dismutase, Fe-Mn family